ncbi:TPA: hypothetical protein J1W37_004562 [Escherichia coli]|nr:hypothetical protein [Escherichia coli]HBA7646029.1 hypothetical protein [Escherichia coli]HBA7654999.1 hypothetical protein [Escherichia coli]HBA7728457.1 hypothetical protein [Escherichia coli]HBA7732987.1 hypothetical protein [Escherichia coli]
MKLKILLTGTCWYELTGLWHLLSTLGYDVFRVPYGNSCIPDCWDLVIVALSAEPVSGWGRYLPWIRSLKSQLSGKMMVFVPERLKNINVLQDICPVYSGNRRPQYIIKFINAALRYKDYPATQLQFTDGQLRVLNRLSGGKGKLSLNSQERGLYYHQSRLSKSIGVRNLRLLLIAGIERELSRMIN